MLELAIAEAYRPHAPSHALKKSPPRRSSFATNPKTRAPTFSLRPRPVSYHSSGASARSQPRSFRSILSWSKRTDSVLSATAEVPENPDRSDSVVSCTKEVPDISAVPVSGNRLHLPPTVPLPPQEDLEDFDLALQSAITELQDATPSSAHDQASTAVSHFAHIADIISCVATSWPEFWTMLVHAAQLLCSAKQIMSGCVENCLAQALERVARRFNEEQGKVGGDNSTAELASIAGGAFDQVLWQMEDMNERLGGVFGKWLENHIENLHRVSPCAPAWSAISHPARSGVKQKRVLRVLTPNPSPAIFAMLLHTLCAMPSLSITLSVLTTPDSIPPSELLQIPPSTSRLHTTVFPVQAIGTVSQDVDILLLHAETIDYQGNIQSTRGALAAAACVKSLSPLARVVVLGGLDRIVPKLVRREKDGEPSSVLGLKPEGGDVDVDVRLAWAPARLMDTYLVETGLLEPGEIEKLSVEAGERKRYIFGE